MKRVEALGLIAAIGLAACAHNEQAARSFPNDDTLTGWVTFRGEFLLYPRREDIGCTLDRSCVSGTFAKLKKFDAFARRFDGKHVRIVGRLLPVEAYYTDLPIGQIENYCASKQVMIATDMFEVPVER